MGVGERSSVLRVDLRGYCLIMEAQFEYTAVNVKNRSHSITAEVEIPAAGAEGVLLAHGSWFAGYSADHVAVVWVGRDDYKSTGLSGSTGAMPIWARLMRDLNVRGLDDAPPAEVETALVDPASGLLANDHCAATETMPFIAGYLPTSQAPCTGSLLEQPATWLQEIFQ